MKIEINYMKSYIVFLLFILVFLLNPMFSNAQKNIRDSLTKISEKEFGFDTSSLEIGFVGEILNCKSKDSKISHPLYDIIVFEKNFDSTCNLYTILYFELRIKLKTNTQYVYLNIYGDKFPPFVKNESLKENIDEILIYNVFMEEKNKIYKFPKKKVYREN